MAQRHRALDLDRLREDIRTRRLGRLLVTRLDRVARRDAIVMELSELCDRHGVEFLSLRSGRVDTSTASGWLSVKVELLLAEHYSRQLSESVLKGLEASIQRGEAPLSSANLSFHLARDPSSRLGVVPSARWAQGRQIVERVLAGESLNSICREPGAPHARAAALSKWLRSPALIGRYKGRDVWPAIASAAEQDRIIERLDESRRRWGATAAAPVYALSGICRCEECGAPLSYSVSRSRNGKLRQRLRCSRPRACRGTVAPLLIEQNLLLEYLQPRIVELAEYRSRPLPKPGAEHPQAHEWRRELRFRREFAATQSDHDRIRELEIMLTAPATADAGPDPSKVAELALVLGDNSLRGWLDRPEHVRNEDFRFLLKAASVHVSERRLCGVRWKSEHR
jgi:hypothetical protein